VSVLSVKKTVATLLLLLTLAGSSLAGLPGVGFQARLDDPLEPRERLVTRYTSHSNRFSAAIYPLSYTVLSKTLLFDGQVVSSSFESNSLNIETTFYRGRLTLVPLSVDATEYLYYRLGAIEAEQKKQIVSSALMEARRGNKRQGLSIGVGLPKRFDRMFGEGGANLRVSGKRRITFSGRSQWNDNAGSGIRRQSKFPALRMEQISRFDITGTIGSKISVKVSQDNQTDIPLANRLIIRYRGDEDDILKTIEAGNTNLNLPNTRFVGYSSHIRGLFGIKTEVQLGDLRLTAIASQEKGSSESASVSATGEENARYIRDYAYVEGRIFDLGYPGEISPRDSVRNIIVYETETSTRDLGSIRRTQLLVDPENPTAYPFRDEELDMRQLQSDEYELLYGQDTLKCPIAIVFHRQRRDRAVGVYMEIARWDDQNNQPEGVDTIGILRSGLGAIDTLKFLRSGMDKYAPDHPTWQLMWRNCYRIDKGVRIEDIDLKVFKGLPKREGTSSSLDNQVFAGASEGQYLQILGLDQYNNNLRDTKIPDGLLDDLPEVFRPYWGLIIFPHREPFNTDTTFVDKNGSRTAPLRDSVSIIYNYLSPRERADHSEYFLQVSSKTRSSVIRLGRANIIEGSERVTSNGQLLTEGQDYTINYNIGQVSLIGDVAADQNADVKVEFQYAPFLALQKKSLLGFRAEYEMSSDFKFGTTVLYKSDKAEDRKPRVGQETSKALVLDFDVSFMLRPNFLTKAVDAIPFLSTQSPSRLQVSAEVAQSRPNPNVEGQAYIDDFESAMDLLSMGLARTQWTLASEPLSIQRINDLLPEERYERGTIRWHNPGQINRADVYEGDVAIDEGSLTPLRLIFRPRPFVNFVDTDGLCTDSIIPTRSWGGILRRLSGVDAKRLQLFEIRAMGGKGILHFDFGTISEDINGNDVQNTEDLSDPRNYSLDKGEDIGLDTTPDENEIDRCGLGYNVTSNPDPTGDNWWYQGIGEGTGENSERPPVPLNIWNLPGFQNRVNNSDDWLHFEWLNGTEGNALDDAVIGDTDDEGLARGRFEENNAYFTFALPLDPLTSPYVDLGSEKNDWYTYRVPVRAPGVLDTIRDDPTFDVGWENVTHVRVWFEKDSSVTDGMTGTGYPDESLDSLSIDSVWIARWGFVQSNWQDTLYTLESDNVSKFHIVSVSEEDLTFKPPPGVEAHVDKVRNVTEPQRGLSLEYQDLDPWAVAIATKDIVNTESYSGYRRLEMYVHGPEDLGSDNILFFFRLGRDSLNYYEYTTQLSPGWASSNHVSIDFNDITALKDAAEKNLERHTDPVDTAAGPYHVVGHPNINEVRFLAAGLINQGTRRVTGKVWLDELRVTDVRKDVGTAARVTVSGSAADLFSYNFAYEHRDPYFRGLSQVTRGGSKNNLGSGREQNNLSYGGTLNLQKLLPRSWNARLPVTVSFSQAEDIPLLRTNSDVILPDDIRQQEKSISKSYKLSFRESFSRKGSNILFNAFLNRQTFSFSYNRSDRKTVNNPLIFGENYNFKADFDMGSRKEVTAPIFFWTSSIPILKRAADSRLSLYPDQWKWSATFNRSLQLKDDQDFKRTSSFSRSLDGSMNLNYRPFPNLSTGYTMRTRRDLTDDALVNLSLKNPKLGLEKNFSESFRASYDPKLFTFLTGSLTYSATFSDNYDRSSETRNTSLSRSWSVNGSFKHVMLFGGGGQQRRTHTPGITRGRVTGQVTEEKEVKGKPFYTPVLSGLRFLTGWLNPLSYKYGQSFNRTVPGALSRPPWTYRLGLNTDIDIPLGKTNRNPSSSESISYDLGSGFSFLGGFSASINYRRSISRDLFRVGGDRGQSTSTNWPDMSLTIKKFSYLPFIEDYVNWFISVFSPRTGFSRQVKENTNLDRGFVTNRSENIGRSPVLSMNLKLFSSLSLSSSYSTAKSKDKQANPTTGEPRSETRGSRKTMAVSGKYSFSSPGGIGIPLLGRLKFKSTVSISVDVKFSSSLSETSKSGGSFVKGAESSDFTVSPVISYSFSRQITGGLTGRWQDNNDLKFNRKSHVRELQIWTEIRF